MDAWGDQFGGWAECDGDRLENGGGGAIGWGSSDVHRGGHRGGSRQSSVYSKSSMSLKVRPDTDVITYEDHSSLL